MGGGGVGSGGGVVGWGGQGGCEWRSKVFVKIQKKSFEGRGGAGSGLWGGGGSGGGGGMIRNWGGGGGGSKVWGRWVMWGIGDVNKE